MPQSLPFLEAKALDMTRPTPSAILVMDVDCETLKIFSLDVMVADESPLFDHAPYMKNAEPLLMHGVSSLIAESPGSVAITLQFKL